MNVAQITSSLGAASARELTATGPADARPAGNTTAERKKVAAQFEAILVRQLLGKSVGSIMGGGGGDAVSGAIYGDLMTDVLAQKLTAGQGLGLGRFIEKQLTPRGAHSDSTDAAPQTKSSV